MPQPACLPWMPSSLFPGQFLVLCNPSFHQAIGRQTVDLHHDATQLCRSPSNRNLEAVGRAALKFDAGPSLAGVLPLAAAALKG